MCRSRNDPDGPRSCSAHCRAPYAAARARARELDRQIASLKADSAATKPTVADLEAAGYAAAVAGRPAAPSLDPAVTQALEGAQVGDARSVEAMKAFSRGYAARLDEELAETMPPGYPGTAPQDHPKLQAAIASSDVGTGQLLAKNHAETRKIASFSTSTREYRFRLANETESLAKTRGPLAGTSSSSEAIEGAYRAALGESPDTASAWRSADLVKARHEYGPGSSDYTSPAHLDDPASATNRDLRNAENDLFYYSEHHPHSASEVESQLDAIRVEMTSRGLGPKAL